MCETEEKIREFVEIIDFSSYYRRRAIYRTLHWSAISVIRYNCHDDRATAELTRREYVGTAE